eukprot:scaffold6331_cov195-Cylindrotheca_fusiformis.AAC.7
MVHFCSENSGKSSNRQPFALLGITPASSSDSKEQAIQSFRELLASKLEMNSSLTKAKSCFRTLRQEELLRNVSQGGLPLLSVPSPKPDFQNLETLGGLKEVAVPFFDFAEYKDGSTFFSHFSEARRPVFGVYQWGDSGTRIRPLPTASEDRRLPPPSLIFHNKDLSQIKETAGVEVAKIGYGGNKIGQLMLQHEDLLGLDIRLCSSADVTSAFCEAQDSLLAGSLNELQSTNTLLAAGEEGKDDERIGEADCWVEVRANLKSPSGYLTRSVGSRVRKVANASNTPDS